jgi:hypothetical protein
VANGRATPSTTSDSVSAPPGGPVTRTPIQPLAAVLAVNAVGVWARAGTAQHHTMRIATTAARTGALYSRASPGRKSVRRMGLVKMSKIVVAAFVAAAVALPAAAQGSASHTCNIHGKERKLGTTYVTSLKATGVSCGRAVRFVKSFHKCRHRHGKAGRCAHLSGYKCSEHRESIPTQYDSRATCTRGHRKIVQIYTQNT